jgi:hypothetical protein
MIKPLMVLVTVGPTKAPAEVTTPEPVVVRFPVVEIAILAARSEPEILLKEGAPPALPCKTVVVVPGRVDRAPPAALVTTPAAARAVSVKEEKVPEPAEVPPILPGEAKVAPPKEEAFKLATLVVEATTKGAVPVVAVEVN